MRTVGIDLASADANTAAAVVDWEPGRAIVREVRVSVSDDGIVELRRDADVLAIDAPLGWPVEFARAVAAYSAGDAWPEDAGDELWYRETDHRVRTVRRPMSVSSDRIARPAARAARLLTRLGPGGRAAARDGSDNVIEAYPAGALARWGFEPSGYKGRAGAAARRALVAALAERAAWLEFGVHRPEIERSDHALDALVAAFIARASALGLVDQPADEHERQRARLEGFIWLPTAESLEQLAGCDRPSRGRSSTPSGE